MAYKAGEHVRVLMDAPREDGIFPGWEFVITAVDANGLTGYYLAEPDKQVTVPSGFVAYDPWNDPSTKESSS